MLDDLTKLLNRAERGIEAVLSPEEAGDADASGRQQVELRIELGRTRLQPDDVRELRSGAVLVLDGSLGEPAAIYAAGRLIGRGEIVVINGTIGVRVTELLQAQPLAVSQMTQPE
jgi:flagellar motor switch protein FliN